MKSRSATCHWPRGGRAECKGSDVLSLPQQARDSGRYEEVSVLIEALTATGNSKQSGKSFIESTDQSSAHVDKRDGQDSPLRYEEVFTLIEVLTASNSSDKTERHSGSSLDFSLKENLSGLSFADTLDGDKSPKDFECTPKQTRRTHSPIAQCNECEYAVNSNHAAALVTALEPCCDRSCCGSGACNYFADIPCSKSPIHRMLRRALLAAGIREAGTAENYNDSLPDDTHL
jgi:hypothetical protein